MSCSEGVILQLPIIDDREHVMSLPMDFLFRVSGPVALYPPMASPLYIEHLPSFSYRRLVFMYPSLTKALLTAVFA